MFDEWSCVSKAQWSLLQNLKKAGNQLECSKPIATSLVQIVTAVVDHTIETKHGVSSMCDITGFTPEIFDRVFCRITSGFFFLVKGTHDFLSPLDKNFFLMFIAWMTVDNA